MSPLLLVTIVSAPSVRREGGFMLSGILSCLDRCLIFCQVKNCSCLNIFFDFILYFITNLRHF